MVWHNANIGYGESYTMDGRVPIDAQQMVKHSGTSGTVIKTKVAPHINWGHVLNQFVFWNKVYAINIL